MSILLKSRVPNQNFESLDSIGLGKITEGQLKPIIELIKSRRLLKESPPMDSVGRGIVIAGGGRYLDWSWVNCRWTRHMGVNLPIQVWFLGPGEMPERVLKHFAKLDVELVDAFDVRRAHWHRKLAGWSTKQYAAMRCPWREVLSLDADCFLACEPEHVLDSPEFQEKGAFFVADVNKCRTSDWCFYHFGIPVEEQEFESGYFAWDRVKVWEGIKLTHWCAEHSEILDRIIWGDKMRSQLAFGTLGIPYVFAREPRWEGWGIAHPWKGKTLCSHAMAHKRGEHPPHSPLIPGFFEEWRSLTS